MNVTMHFMERVAERVGQDVCAHALARSVIAAVAEGADSVRFVGKGNKGNPVYGYHIDGRGLFYIMLSPDRQRAITIMPPGYHIARRGKGRSKKLKGGDA